MNDDFRLEVTDPDISERVIAKHWAVMIEINGERVLTLSSEHLAGVSDIDKHAATIRYCADCLRNFIGDKQRDSEVQALQAAADRSEMISREFIAAQADKRLLLEALRNARRTHWESYEDCWYACPKSEHGCCNDAEGDDCNCGADNHNAAIDAIIGKVGGK